MENSLLDIYRIAANVSTPLALASTTILLFFILLRNIINRLKKPIEKATGRQAFIVIMTVLSYGFILAIVATVGGFGLYGYEVIYERYFLKQNLVGAAEAAINNNEPEGAIIAGNNIISDWPADYKGYSILGTAYFIKGDYEISARQFELAILKINTNNYCEIEARNLIANAVAANASMGKSEYALELMKKIEACQLEKGMLVNYAKLLMFSGNPSKALSILNDEYLRDSGRPDYRDRVAFEAAVAHLLQREKGWRDAAEADFLTAVCLNDRFERLLTRATIASQTDPPGDLIQVFSKEIEIIKQDKNKYVISKVMSKLRQENACESI